MKEIRQEPPLQAKGETMQEEDQQEKRTGGEVVPKAYSDYQHNIKTSEALRAEILKGLASGESHAVILEKAIRCIGIMTNDDAFTKQAANML